MTTRRDFVKKAAGAGLGAAAIATVPGAANAAARIDVAGAPAIRTTLVRPTAIASGNGVAAVAEAVRVIQNGGDTLEAVVRGVNIVELDPDDMSVGYGGLPNEDGVVQLDASVMHGPTRGAGSVGCLEGVRTPSRVAVAVMRYTDHVMLVGEGARLFARRMGFDTNEELLTEESRRRWLEWRARHSPVDDWLTPSESGERVEGHTIDVGSSGQSADREFGLFDYHGDPMHSFDGVRPWGTINCDAVDAQGNLSGVTTTSGLFGKLPGRVGDSPIIGAGLYVDNDVGAAGSTGRGEAVIKTVGSHTIVEGMRRGLSPTDACLEACRRIVTWTIEPRLLREDGRPNFNVEFYALDKQGRHGGAAIYEGSRYAANVDGVATSPDAHSCSRGGGSTPCRGPIFAPELRRYGDSLGQRPSAPTRSPPPLAVGACHAPRRDPHADVGPRAHAGLRRRAVRARRQGEPPASARGARAPRHHLRPPRPGDRREPGRL